MGLINLNMLALPYASATATVPVGTVVAFMGQTVPEGWLLCDGREVSRTDYPTLFSTIGITYGAGDGVSTFNLPRLTDNRFLEGAPTAGTAKEAGLPNIEGGINCAILSLAGGAYPGYIVGSGVFNDSVVTSYGSAGQGGQHAISVSFSAKNSNPIYGNSSTVQPRALTVMYIIRAVDALNDSFSIIYPNGGSKSAPANVTINTRYIEAHPFPGYHVHCMPEVMINNKWGETGWIYNSAADTNGNGGYGIKASEYDEYIVVQTGGYALIAYSSNDGNPFGLGISNYPTVNHSTLPCRIKVWKVGRMEADE